MMAITPVYAGFFGFMLVFLSWRVVHLRNKLQIKMGDDGHNELTAATRAQSHLLEYLPLSLLLMFILEGIGSNPYVIHGLGILLVAARLLHLKSLHEPSGQSMSRKIGTRLTWLQICIASALCFLSAFGVIF